MDPSGDQQNPMEKNADYFTFQEDLDVGLFEENVFFCYVLPVSYLFILPVTSYTTFYTNLH